MDTPITQRRRAPHLREEERKDLPGEPFVYQQADVEAAPENRDPEDGPAADADPRAQADADNWHDRQRQPDDPSEEPPADPGNRDPKRPTR